MTQNKLFIAVKKLAKNITHFQMKLTLVNLSVPRKIGNNDGQYNHHHEYLYLN